MDGSNSEKEKHKNGQDLFGFDFESNDVAEKKGMSMPEPQKYAGENVDKNDLAAAEPAPGETIVKPVSGAAAEQTIEPVPEPEISDEKLSNPDIVEDDKANKSSRDELALENIFSPRRRHKPTLEEETLEAADFSFGQYLKEIRNKRNYSLEKVEQDTRISKSYIESIEAEDLSKLPAGVYVSAYVRMLCKYYEISLGRSDLILDELKSQLKYTVPNDLFDKLQFEPDEDAAGEQKMRYLLLGLGGAAAFFIALVTIAVIMLFSGDAPPENSAGSVAGQPLKNTTQFEQAKLKKLVAPQLIEMSELPEK